MNSTYLFSFNLPLGYTIYGGANNTGLYIIMQSQCTDGNRFGQEYGFSGDAGPPVDLLVESKGSGVGGQLFTITCNGYGNTCLIFAKNFQTCLGSNLRLAGANFEGFTWLDQEVFLC